MDSHAKILMLVVVALLNSKVPANLCIGRRKERSARVSGHFGADPGAL